MWGVDWRGHNKVKPIQRSGLKMRNEDLNRGPEKGMERQTGFEKFGIWNYKIQ